MIAVMLAAPEHLSLSKELPVTAFLSSVHACGIHYHRALEFLLILQGRLGIKIDRDEHLLREGDVVLVHGNVLHETYGVGESNLVLAVQIDPMLLTSHDPEFAKRVFAFNELSLTRPDAPVVNQMRPLLANIMWEWKLQRPGWRMQVDSLVRRLAVLMLREIPNHIEEAPASAVFEEDHLLRPRMQRIVEYIMSHADESVSLQAVAEHEGISTEYLSRLFKMETEQTFKGFITSIRLRRSLDQLAAPESRILDVALSSGFPNVKAYNAAFHRAFGVSPSEWRRDIKPAPPGATEKGNAYLPVDIDTSLQQLKRYLGSGTDPL